MPARPVDPTLHDAVNREIYKDNPTPTAYRSGMIVREYKRRSGS